MPSPMPSRLPLRGAALAVSLLPLALFAAEAGASAPTATVQITGLSGNRLVGPKSVTLKQSSFVLRAGSASKTCNVAQGTPLAGLMQSGVTHVIKDFGSCSRNPIDSASLFVDSIRGVSGTGMQGWSYKVGNRAGTAGAADPNGPFGSGQVRSGSRILWFWCTYDPTTYACQRTLGIAAPSMVRAGARMKVTVHAYDDAGSPIPAADVLVTVGRSVSAVTGSDGTATVNAPTSRGVQSINAVDNRVGIEGSFRPAAFTESLRVY